MIVSSDRVTEKHLPSKDEGLRGIGNKRARNSTQRNVILGVNSGFSIIFLELWNFITTYDRCFITKCNKGLLENVSGFLLQKCDSFITKYDSHYKMRSLLQNDSTHS